MRSASVFKAVFLPLFFLFITLSFPQNKTYAEGHAVGGLSMSVLYSDNEFPNWNVILENFKKDWSDPKEIERFASEQSLSFSVGKKIIVSMSSAPKPVADATIKPALSGSWWWTNASTEISKHTGHIFIFVVPLDKNYLKANRVLTKLTAGLLKSQNSIGAHFATSEILAPKSLYLSEAAKMNDKYLPIMLWVKTYIGSKKGEDGKVKSMARTVGMRNFDLLEIETSNGPENLQDLQSIIWGLARFLTKKGDVVKDGQTIGRSEKEKVKVVRKTSMYSRNKKVYFLQFP